MENKKWNSKFKILIVIFLLLAIVWSWVWYFLLNKDKFSNKWPIEGTETKTINWKVEWDVSEQTKWIFLDEEIKKKISMLNKVLKTNYLKITDFQRKENLWKYTSTGVEFYRFAVDYDFSEPAMADYDVMIEKGSLTEEEYVKKPDLYKKQIQERMLKFFDVYQYDRLKTIWIIWYIKNEDGWNTYWLYQLWEYVKDKFYDKSLKPDLLAKMDVIIDYLNYQPIFFNKEPKEIHKIFKEVVKWLDKNEDFKKLAPIIEKVYFYDVETKK